MIERKMDSLSDYANYLKTIYNEMKERTEKEIKTFINEEFKSGDAIWKNEIPFVNQISKNTKSEKKIKAEFIDNHPISTTSKTITFLINRAKSDSYKKKYPNKKLGRLKKDLKENGVCGIHTQNDAGNGKRRAINHCIHSFYHQIKFLFPNIKLLEITINKKLVKTDEDIKNLFDYSIEYIIFCSKPRKRNDLDYFKNKINEIINSKHENVKILKILLSSSFRKVLIMYLNGINYFKYFDSSDNSKKIYILKNFKTFNDGLSNVDINVKDRIKNNLLNLLKNKSNQIEGNEFGNY